MLPMFIRTQKLTSITGNALSRSLFLNADLINETHEHLTYRNHGFSIRFTLWLHHLFHQPKRVTTRVK